MNIVVMRKTSLGAETFARAMVGKNVSLQKANATKVSMLNQFRGHINQLSGNGITNPLKRYWVFNDGLGGAWRFDFVIYPVQQLVIIYSFYAVAFNKSLIQRQRRAMQQNENIVKLTEADLRYIVSETSRRVVNGYADHPIWGWNYCKKQFLKSDVNDEDLAKLKHSYDIYAQETISKGEIPNNRGFDLWRDNKNYHAQQQGVKALFPDYTTDY